MSSGIVTGEGGGGVMKMLVRSLYGNREFHVLFLSMIYVVLKFTLSDSEIEFEF